MLSLWGNFTSFAEMEAWYQLRHLVHVRQVPILHLDLVTRLGSTSRLNLKTSSSLVQLSVIEIRILWNVTRSSLVFEALLRWVSHGFTFFVFIKTKLTRAYLVSIFCSWRSLYTIASFGWFSSLAMKWNIASKQPFSFKGMITVSSFSFLKKFRTWAFALHFTYEN